MKKEEAGKLAVSIFNTQQGKDFLEYLRQESIEKTSVPEQACDGHAMSLLMSFNEGEKNMVRRIERLIKIGESIE